MTFLTDFGDSGLLLPLSALILVWLLAVQPLRAALSWMAALAFLGAAMGSLKILFFACPPASDITSPSGHTAFSVTVYGCLAVILTERTAKPVRFVILAAALAFTAGIAVSRIFLRMHTIPEAVIGYAVGVFAVGIFMLGYRRSAPRGRHRLTLLIGIAALLTLLHGIQLNPENKIHDLSRFLRIGRLFCSR